MQLAGVDGDHTIFLLEDHQIVTPTFLEFVNSLLSSGEVPGLYTSEELEPLLSPLKDAMSEEGYRGSLFGYFSQRVRTHLHIVLIMDLAGSNFTANCESNPALYTHCSYQCMEQWSQQTMLAIPDLFLRRLSTGGTAGTDLAGTSGEQLAQGFFHVHQSCSSLGGSTPRTYITFLKTYRSVYQSKKEDITKRQKHLQAGVFKLNEATSLVDELKTKAAKQRALLSEKQSEADSALREITASMQTATEQKNEMEIVQARQNEERAKLEKRKKAIDIELSEIEPLVAEARNAVGNIKSDNLAEIRALRAPPDVIRHILEAVLRIMGVFDTSFASMRSFLARRGVKEEIMSFDARKINPEIRQSVEELLKKNKNSFEPAVAKRASLAAAPLASWVRANIRYSFVLEKIEPLETEQAQLKKGLEKSEAKLVKLERNLERMDRRVKEMRDRFEVLTTEAAKLQIEVEREEEIIAAAENLVGKLEGEHKRWSKQVGELTRELEQLPMRVLLVSGFITYLSQTPEDRRREKLADWHEKMALEEFDLQQFLSTESELLVWKGEGLPSDNLSVENALVILQGQQCPFLIDPSQRATEWLEAHLRESRLEVVNQQDSNFITSLELAVRFGKTLIIQEVDGVEPVLFPLLRKDLETQGPRFVVQVGEKVVDYNENFRLFLTTRNPAPEIPPDASSIVTTVNFTTTRAGLTAQLLALTIQHEKPELEKRKTDLLKAEEDLKVQLARLEESLLHELATAKGSILENKVLLDSLNETKAKSSTISTSLEESQQLQASLDQERNSYIPLAKFGSALFFVISDLSKLNNMYRFSIASFLSLFRHSLESKQDLGNTELRIRALTLTLQAMVYEYVCRSLFKADRLMFALHLVHGMHPRLFHDNEWDAFVGRLVIEFRRQESMKQMREAVPAWCDAERAAEISQLKSNFPTLFNGLDLHATEMWASFGRTSMCEKEFPPSVMRKITHFQQLLVIQTLRPDRLQTAMEQFAMKVLGLKELSPTTLNLRRLYSNDTSASEPILIIISPGADPSQEIEELANSVVGGDHFHQVAMGQGQSEVALGLLRDCAQNGDWLCLKNLHLVTGWLPTLEKELNSLEPHKQFRLWLTTETHPRFPTILLQSSLKVTYESPPGVRKNLQRTYDSWAAEYVTGSGSVYRSQALFALAWFHAVVQERCSFIPQGWSKFYEFTLADLRVAASIIDRLCSGQGERNNTIRVSYRGEGGALGFPPPPPARISPPPQNLKIIMS